jgi:hypothetical protein
LIYFSLPGIPGAGGPSLPAKTSNSTARRQSKAMTQDVNIGGSHFWGANIDKYQVKRCRGEFDYPGSQKRMKLHRALVF